MDNSLVSVKGISKIRMQSFNTLGVFSSKDLLTFYPVKYEDRTKFKSISEVYPGCCCSLCATVVSSTLTRIRTKMSLLKVKISDGTGYIDIIVFNQDYLKKTLQCGTVIYLYGEVKRGHGTLEIINPVIILKSKISKEEFCRILPKYSLTAGLSQNIVRKIMKDYISSMPLLGETLPLKIIQLSNLCDYDFAIRNIHFPVSINAYEEARKRLAFEELLTLQIMIRNIKNTSSLKYIKGFEFGEETNTFKLIKSLPFTLSLGQLSAWSEIKSDMEKPYPMNRLLLGDVGSGKTIIAVLAMLKAISNGYQALFMAPTEILAAQHYKNISKLFDSFGIKTALLTGSLKKSERTSLHQSILSGEVKCIVGTQALIQPEMKYKNVGIVITDEQHRFGVYQRALLAESGINPDILIMSATPIPRTLALSLYGDMDVSKIDVLPKGRLPIKTYAVKSDMKPRIYSWARKLIDEGNRVYVVHAMITSNNEDEDETPTINDGIITAEENFRELSSKYFSDVKTGLLHGKMSNQEKDDVMASFVKGETSVLFSTTVIEVGVDVPEASVIIIENAERFGLAQLHQLRGRVGRSNRQSFCVLISDSENEIAVKRLETMVKTTNGFEIAEMDLQLRGPGDFFGTAQHGLPEMKIANLYEDMDLLKQARDCADIILSEYPSYAESILEKTNKKITSVY